MKKFFKQNFWYLSAFNSPFRGLKLEFYKGKPTIGTPWEVPMGKFSWKYSSYTIKYKWGEFVYSGHDPLLSIVLFGVQIVFKVVPQITCNRGVYWEALHYYVFETDKHANKYERLKQTTTNLSLTFKKYGVEKEQQTIDYYPMVLKNKYAFQYIITSSIETIAEFIVASSKPFAEITPKT
jgi:hypothetical protein